MLLHPDQWYEVQVTILLDKIQIASYSYLSKTDKGDFKNKIVQRHL